MSYVYKDEFSGAIAQQVAVVHYGDYGLTHSSVSVAEEVPVAFRFGGFAHAVMMATPAES